MTRRGFLGLAAAMTLDPERLLWVPGAKHISIPALRPFNWDAAIVYDEIIAAYVVTVDWYPPLPSHWKMALQPRSYGRLTGTVA